VEAVLDELGEKATVTLTSSGEQIKDVSLEYLVRIYFYLLSFATAPLLNLIFSLSI
jgi:hypothetical protein